MPDLARKHDWVRISVSDGTIVAKRVDNILLKIKPHWNEETLTCDLCIGDRAFFGRAFEPEDSPGIYVRSMTPEMVTYA